MGKTTRPECAPQAERRTPPPRPFVVTNAACAKCGGDLRFAPGGWPTCPACNRVRLTGGRKGKAVRP